MAREQSKQRVERMKADARALYLARRDPRIPWYARALAVIVLAYALSPIDLVPDFIPVLGYLDDLVIVPLGIVVVLRMVPDGVLREYRFKAAGEMRYPEPKNRIAALVVAAIWLTLAALLTLVVYMWTT